MLKFNEVVGQADMRH